MLPTEIWPLIAKIAPMVMALTYAICLILLIDKLKREINCLCDRIAKAERLENAQLRLKLKQAEEENVRLKAMLLENGVRSSVIEHFDKSGNRN